MGKVRHILTTLIGGVVKSVKRLPAGAGPQTVGGAHTTTGSSAGVSLSNQTNSRMVTTPKKKEKKKGK